MFHRARKRRPSGDGGPTYYVYVSDSKVDMLFAQLPEDRRVRLERELKVSINVVSMSVKDGPAEDTRFSKLKVVCADLEQRRAVGTVDEPREYFSGTLDMRWGPYDADDPQDADVVYFGRRRPRPSSAWAAP